MSNIPESDGYVQITVKDQHNKKELFFKMKRDQPVRKVLVSYCKRRDLDYRTAIFLFEGIRFSHYKTPDQLKMEDKDEIEVMTHSLGGGYSKYIS